MNIFKTLKCVTFIIYIFFFGLPQVNTVIFLLSQQRSYQQSIFLEFYVFGHLDVYYQIDKWYSRTVYEEGAL